METKEILARMEKSIIEGDKEKAENLAKEAVREKIDLNEVIEKGYVPGIQKVGELWEKGEYFLPELITSAECMKAAMNVLQPALSQAKIETKSLGKIVIGVIAGLVVMLFNNQNDRYLRLRDELLLDAPLSGIYCQSDLSHS